MVAAFVLAVVLLALLVVLGVTSFNFAKKRMRAETWKKVQRLAYPFFMLVYVHLLLMLAPAVPAGRHCRPNVGFAVYSAVFLAYAALRLARAAWDRKAQAAA